MSATTPLINSLNQLSSLTTRQYLLPVNTSITATSFCPDCPERIYTEDYFYFLSASVVLLLCCCSSLDRWRQLLRVKTMYVVDNHLATNCFRSLHCTVVLVYKWNCIPSKQIIELNRQVAGVI